MLAGEQYTDAILPLKIVMLAIVFVGITNILGVQILIPLKKETALLDVYKRQERINNE